MMEQLACRIGRNDEEPNIELAVQLCDTHNSEGIKEIVSGMNGTDKAVTNDCIKVLYEIGERKPKLIADYAMDFITHLLSKNNRLSWGSMCALATIADLNPKVIYENIYIVRKAYETGSVIAIDNSITVFAKLCKANSEYEANVFPIILQHLMTCRPKEVAQHSERASICINKNNADVFLSVLEKRKPELTDAQLKRVHKLTSKIPCA